MTYTIGSHNYEITADTLHGRETTYVLTFTRYGQVLGRHYSTIAGAKRGAQAHARQHTAAAELRAAELNAMHAMTDEELEAEAVAFINSLR